jgi:hypothetical protein
MKGGTFGPPDAMNRPDTAERAEMFCIRRVPIATCQHRQPGSDKTSHRPVDRIYDPVAVTYLESAARAKIVLHIHDQQSRFLTHRSRPITA